MLNKRGISPLIATVLIIGFTISLAAVIISWGQTFTRQIQQETETSSNEQIACATEVVFDINNACKIMGSPNGEVKVIVKNDGSRKIDKFLVRSYRAADNVVQNELTFNDDGIPAFGIEPQTYIPAYTSGTGPTKLVELIPVVTIEGKQVTCSLNIKRYGQVDGPGLLDC